MSELDQVLGSILSSLAHARRIADQETAAIAEYYRNQPLLEGMTLPRVRVPELVLDLPVLIEQDDVGSPEKLEKPDIIRKAVSARLMTAAAAEGVRLPKAVRDRFDRNLEESFQEAGLSARMETRTRDDVVRAVERAYAATIESEPVARLDERQSAAVSSALSHEARVVSVLKERVPPSMKVTVRTADVKDKSDPGTVTRLKIVLREEGLEWSSYTDEDGKVHRVLTPE